MKYQVIVNPDVVLDVDVIDVETDSMTIAFVPPWDGGGYITSCIYSYPTPPPPHILLTTKDVVYVSIMTMDFVYNDFFYAFDNSNVQLLKDGRNAISVPAFFNVFHSFAVSALNIGELSARPSEFSEEYLFILGKGMGHA